MAGTIDGSEAPGVGPAGVSTTGVVVPCCVSMCVVLVGAKPDSMRSPTTPPTSPPPADDEGLRPTGGGGALSGAGAPRTTGAPVVPEDGSRPFEEEGRSTGASATGAPSGGDVSPGHPFTATRVLVKASTHAAAATSDRVAPRVASRPLGVRT
jgi:hypothetical protein